MSKLEIRLGGAVFSNPVFGASGCMGFGFEMAPYADIRRLGAVALKTVTPKPKSGNPPPRIIETTAGMLSSIGLQNPGIDAFLSEIWPVARDACRPGQLILSIAGDTSSEYLEMVDKAAEKISPGQIAALEVNAACPNVKHGGAAICHIPSEFKTLMRQIKDRSPFPVIGKINTNSGNFCDAARAIEDAGADAVCLTNTPIGMAIDLRTRKPALGNVKGPLTGPAIRPIGIARTWDVYRSVSIPIIAGGGVYSAKDVLEYLLSGATAVDIGSANFADPAASVKILDHLETYLDEQKISSVKELIGAAHL